MIRLALLLLVGCNEYRLEKEPDHDPPPGSDTGDPPPVDTAVDTAPPPDTGDPVETDLPELSPCDDVALETLPWWGSMPFTTEPDPTDSAGRAFYADGFDLRDWSTVALPDSGHTPPGHDRAYRAVLSLPALGERVFVEVQSDDGLWLWVNGAAVGHWGGGWQEEGCVNDEARCLETVTVAPVEVTDYLRAGDNVVAARVSNAVDQSYFQLHAYCPD